MASPDAAALPRISMAGAGAILLDGAGGEFDLDVQRRVLTVAKAVRAIPSVRAAVPGMNNLMVIFDPLDVAPEWIESQVLRLWGTCVLDAVAAREIVIPVVYGGSAGEDLPDLARHCGLSVDEVIRLHAAAAYSVAAVGAMPGFPYLSGLDRRLARPRRANPRSRVPAGSVIIGGAQAGIMPCMAPSGWHIIGRTGLTLFDPRREPPATLKPGDSVRFEVTRVDS